MEKTEIDYPLRTVYMVLSPGITADGTGDSPAMESWENLAIPESVSVLFFHAFLPYCLPRRVQRALDDHRVEFSTSEEDVSRLRLHSIPCQDDAELVNTCLKHCTHLHAILPADCSLVIIGDYTRKQHQKLQAGLSKIMILRHVLIASQIPSSPRSPLINDLHAHSLITQVTGTQPTLFKDQLKRVLEVLSTLANLTIFCAGKFQASLNLHRLPFSPLFLFNQLVRDGVLTRAKDQFVRDNIKTKRPHVIHLLQVQRARDRLAEIENLDTPSPASGISDSPHVSKKERDRLSFETLLMRWWTGECSSVESTVDSSGSSTYKDRLLRLLKYHYPSAFENGVDQELIMYETEPALEFLDDSHDGLLDGSVTIMDDRFESSVISANVAEVEEDCARVAYQYFLSYFEACKASGKLADDGKLESFLVHESSQDSPPTNPQPAAVESDVQLLRLFDSYLRYCGLPQRPAISYDGSKDRYFVAGIAINDRTFRTERGFGKKSAAKCECMKIVLRLLVRRIEAGCHLEFDLDTDFDEI